MSLPEDAREAHRALYRERLEVAMGIPFTDGNGVAPLHNGREIFPAMLEAISAAERTIDFETYVYWQGEIAARFGRALCARARAGVRVRILLDSFGAKKIERSLLEEFDASGAEVRWFRPLATWRVWRTDKRTHRKLLICDDQLGFTGGVGIAGEWEGDARSADEWRDLHVQINGPAVGGLRSAFVENWNEAGAWSWDEDVAPPEARRGGVPIQIVRASATVGWNDIATLMRALVSVARNRITLATAYFVPDDRIVRLLTDAHRRGVEIRLLLQGKHGDSRLSRLAGIRRIETLVEAGIRAYRYDHTMLHMKCLTIDGTLACVGSANFNHRSLGKDEECCAVILDEGFTTDLEARLEKDLEIAKPVSLELLQERPPWVRVQEWIAERIVEEL